MLRWTLIELFKRLYVSLGSHRLGTLEGNLAYVPVMDLGFGSWQHVYSILQNFWQVVYESVIVMYKFFRLMHLKIYLLFLEFKTDK